MAYDFDVIKLFGSEYCYPCEPTPALQATGWVGGLWVRMNSTQSFRDGNEIRIRRYVEGAQPDDPSFFMRWGSDEPIDRFTSINPGKTGVATIGVYGQFLFKYYEKLNLAERTNPGTGGPVVYTMNQDLYVSNNGLMTSENETGIARTVGILIGMPAENEDYLGVFIGY